MIGSRGITAGSGGGKERRHKGVFVLGSSRLYACSLETVNVTGVTCLGHSAVVLVEGIAPWVIVTSRGRGNCCVVLTVSLPFPKLPCMSDSPSSSPVQEVARAGSAGL